MVQKEAFQKLQAIFRVLIGEAVEEWTSQMDDSDFDCDSEWAWHLLTIHRKHCTNKQCFIEEAMIRDEIAQQEREYAQQECHFPQQAREFTHGNEERVHHPDPRAHHPDPRASEAGAEEVGNHLPRMIPDPTIAAAAKLILGQHNALLGTAVHPQQPQKQQQQQQQQQRHAAAPVHPEENWSSEGSQDGEFDHADDSMDDFPYSESMLADMDFSDIAIKQEPLDDMDETPLAQVPTSVVSHLGQQQQQQQQQQQRQLVLRPELAVRPKDSGHTMSQLMYSKYKNQVTDVRTTNVNITQITTTRNPTPTPAVKRVLPPEPKPIPRRVSSNKAALRALLDTVASGASKHVTKPVRMSENWMQGNASHNVSAQNLPNMDEIDEFIKKEPMSGDEYDDNPENESDTVMPKCDMQPRNQNTARERIPAFSRHQQYADNDYIVQALSQGQDSDDELAGIRRIALQSFSQTHESDDDLTGIKRMAFQTFSQRREIDDDAGSGRPGKRASFPSQMYPNPKKTHVVNIVPIKKIKPEPVSEYGVDTHGIMEAYPGMTKSGEDVESKYYAQIPVAKRSYNKSQPSQRAPPVATRQHYLCKICDKTFTQMASLRMHLRIHSSDQTVQCPICDKTFPQKRALSHHMKTHSLERASDRDYVCSVCEKTFKEKCDLEEHLNTTDCGKDPNGDEDTPE